MKIIKEFQHFAEKLVTEAGTILVAEQKKAQILTYKDRQDVCTSADLASEEHTCSLITSHYPNHGIISEERGEINIPADYVWIIDPLDGTKEYIRGLPLYNSAVALEYKGEIIASAIFRPAENVLYSAAKGLGAFRNGKKIHTSSVKNLDDSFIYTYLPAYTKNTATYDTAWEKLRVLGKFVYRIRALADTNTTMCWLAQGGCEASLNFSHIEKWHDVAPGLLVAKEAGATITDISGKEVSHGRQDQIIASNGLIHSQLLKILKSK